jgi:hypothetical protein
MLTIHDLQATVAAAIKSDNHQTTEPPTYLPSRGFCMPLSTPSASLVSRILNQFQRKDCESYIHTLLATKHTNMHEHQLKERYTPRLQLKNAKKAN